MTKDVPFELLSESDLIVDRVYKGGDKGDFGDEPISKLMGCDNQGGIRHTGNYRCTSDLKFVILYTTLSEPDWPDFIDYHTGQFIYFGDNKKPGRLLHDTDKKGNIILKKVFDNLHDGDISEIPPFFIFSKAGVGRDVIFRGLAVPGAEALPPTQDLVAIWKSKDGKRFQNYQAIFTILDIDKINRRWIKDIIDGCTTTSRFVPDVWSRWVENREYTPLRSTRVDKFRKKEEQLPHKKDEIDMLQIIYDYFQDPYIFEDFSSRIVKMMDENIVSIELTRPYRDGGRDALGKYRLGLESNSIEVDFAMEAKRYAPGTPVGVKETSRLISRLRYRQFGILITTSYVAKQAYKEIVDDGHPVIILSGKDLITILKRNGHDTKEKLKKYLNMYS